MSNSVNNFIPVQGGGAIKRTGMQHIPYKKVSFIKRLKAWWNGDPTSVSSMIIHNTTLFIGTDKGLYSYDGEKMKRVSIKLEGE